MPASIGDDKIARVHEQSGQEESGSNTFDPVTGSAIDDAEVARVEKVYRLVFNLKCL